MQKLCARYGHFQSLHLYLKGMTNFTILSFLTLLLYSCNQKQDTKYYWVSFHGSYYENSDTNHIFHIDKTYLGDTIKISYFATRDTSTYYLLSSNRDSSFVEGSHDDDDGRIRPFNDTLIFLNNDTFKLTKYVLNELETDGSTIHYYTPKLGIFVIHSGTWPSLTILQSSDTIKNRQIKQLTKIVVPKFFIRGVLEKDF